MEAEAEPFRSNDTMAALRVVGFYPKYGQERDSTWSFNIDSLSRDEAIDANARLLNAMLLQAFPEWECVQLKQDIQDLYDAITFQKGPFSNPELCSAMMKVEIVSVDCE